MIYQYGGSKDAFNEFKLELSSVSFILTLTTFFVVIYSQTAALRFKTMYDKTCGVSEGVQEICIWVSCYFPGDKNERVRWEIARHVIAAQVHAFVRAIFVTRHRARVVPRPVTPPLAIRLLARAGFTAPLPVHVTMCRVHKVHKPPPSPSLPLPSN